MTNEPSAAFVSNVRTPELTGDDLTLDKWRPIPFDKFVATLTNSAFYESDYYIPPVSVNFDLENNTNAIVWCTCCDIEHKDDDSIAVMSPELLVLSSFDANDQRRYLCFVRN